MKYDTQKVHGKPFFECVIWLLLMKWFPSGKQLQDFFAENDFCTVAPLNHDLAFQVVIWREAKLQ